MNVTMPDQNSKIGRMLQLRTELVSLIQWEEENSDYPTQTEIDAVAHRIIHMAELVKRMHEIAERN